MKKILLVLLLIILSPFDVSAQISQDLVGGASIKINPTYPQPESNFTASVDDYSLTTQVKDIKWRVNQQYRQEFDNRRSVNLTSLAVGESLLIEAVLVTANGQEIVLRETVTPLYIDIIVEPQTRVPSFYQGRSLPSEGSLVNLTSIITGYTKSTDELMFNWRLNNKSVHAGPLKGKNTTSVTTPIGSGFIVGLDVSEPNGRIIAKRTIEIRSVTPELHFYEKTSLLGLSNIARKNFSLVGTSLTARAEPYFLDINTYNSPTLIEWRIDNQQSSPSESSPYEITLLRTEEGSSGTSNVAFQVRNLSRVLLGAGGSFRINY